MALHTARSGAYPLSISEQVHESYLNRYFHRQGNQYHVCKQLRDLCVFSVHNLISDPPFSQMHLISCRNLLIYLGRHLQQKLIPLFHFSLVPNGYLLLGPSENLSSHTEIFRSVDSKHRISQRKTGPLRSSAIATGKPLHRELSRSAAAAGPNEFDIDAVAQRIVLDELRLGTP